MRGPSPIERSSSANPQRSADIVPLRLTALDKAAMVDVLRNGLTECRAGH
jgi:hypothetical protein